ncbi:MAG: pyridoxamine 5'-phosphate oxidase family protein [Oscillospiraceae bacterium]|nr:pyridoxamine 5'-phosphate oxidase family protein [Oscillospiraceae bacterium]
MREVYDFLKKCGTYYLATTDGGRPRVRPFGTIDLFEGKLYIQTGKSKDTAKQLAADPHFELCAFDGEQWLRVRGVLTEDDRREARSHMLDAYPSLRRMYDEDDGNTVVYAMRDAEAVFSSFTAPPRTLRF